MKGFKRTAVFKKDYSRLPQNIKDAFWKQIDLLFSDPRHSSLDLKKMQGFANIWRAKVTGGYRFTFQIDGEFYLLRRIGSHDILKTP